MEEQLKLLRAGDEFWSAGLLMVFTCYNNIWKKHMIKIKNTWKNDAQKIMTSSGTQPFFTLLFFFVFFAFRVCFNISLVILYLAPTLICLHLTISITHFLLLLITLQKFITLLLCKNYYYSTSLYLQKISYTYTYILQLIKKYLSHV